MKAYQRRNYKPAKTIKKKKKQFVQNGGEFVYRLTTIVLLLMIIIIKCDDNRKIDTLNTKLSEAINETVTLQYEKANYQQSAVKLMSTVQEVKQEQQEDGTAYIAVINELDEQNKELMDQKEEAYTKLEKTEAQLAEAADRLRLYEEYKYTLYYGGKRTDITYEQLKLGDQLMKGYGLDPHWLFGTLMVESKGEETAKNKRSTATGYGQFLYNTGKFTYEKLLGNGSGTYSSSVALNGDTNIRMMAAYMNYLYHENRNTSNPVYNSIRSYRGKSGSVLNKYIASINSFIGQAGTSIQKMDAS